MDIVYRIAEISDAEKMLEEMKVVGNETDFLTFTGNDVVSLEDEKNFLSNANKAGSLLIAYDNNRDIIVGTIQFASSSRPRIRHRAEIAIAVRSEYWGKGVAKDLMSRAFDILRLRNITKVNLEVVESNARAIAFYKKMGFEEEGRDKRLFLIDGKYFDGIYMGKTLG